MIWKLEKVSKTRHVMPLFVFKSSLSKFIVFFKNVRIRQDPERGLVNDLSGSRTSTISGTGLPSEWILPLGLSIHSALIAKDNPMNDFTTSSKGAEMKTDKT